MIDPSRLRRKVARAVRGCAAADASLVLGCDGGGGTVAVEPLAVEGTAPGLDAITDAALREAEAVRGAATEPVRVRSLSARAAGVRSLEGVDLLASLEALDLAENEVEDVSGLAGLRQLCRLVVRGNRIADAAPLASLTGLRRLCLDSNDLVP